MRVKNFRYFAADFETTVYEGQTRTDVWASASVELGTEDVKIFHSIQDQFAYFRSLKSNLVVYYHNLKFDGSFWLDFLLKELKYKQAFIQTGERTNDITWIEEKNMANKTFKYSISDRGMWYNVIIKVGGYYIELRDSVKLLPFSLKTIGEGFQTKHRKLDMEYKGYRFPGCEIAEKDKRYISNDVLVLKEALEFMFEEGHDKLTIGSCCLGEYKNIVKHSTKLDLEYNEMFPDIYNCPIEDGRYKNVGDWVRSAYRGGWTYLVKGKENKIFHNGTTADVNSLYPSMMHSESGNRFPIGLPHYWRGAQIPEAALNPEHYYYIRVKTRFYLKEGMLPFIQIKNSLLYNSTECLESSDVYIDNSETGEYGYYTHWTDWEGNIQDTRVELTLSGVDFQLMKDHYHLVDFEVIDGCWFYTQIGIFDEYIDKYAEIKKTSKGARRTLAKLFLNNLYGKLASSDDSSFKFAVIKDDGNIGFLPVSEHDKKPGYIPCGAAITSYARNFTIRAAQKNYHGKDKPGFIYADTDSIHCDLPADKIKGIVVDPVAFCCWKLESSWDMATFTRQKTYIEHVTHSDLEPVEPYHDIKCAGMPDPCKELFKLSMEGAASPEGRWVTDSGGEKTLKPWTSEERHFLFHKSGDPIIRDYTHFRKGLEVPGKLMPRRIPGGILLKETTYKIR